MAYFSKTHVRCPICGIKFIPNQAGMEEQCNFCLYVFKIKIMGNNYMSPRMENEPLQTANEEQNELLKHLARNGTLKDLWEI